MTDNIAGCEKFEALLPNLIDGGGETGEREFFGLHAAECRRCDALLRSLAGIRDAARALDDRAPDRDLWPSIRSRIEAPVYDLAKRGPYAAGAGAQPRRSEAGVGIAARARRFVLAAAVLVAVASSLALGGARLFKRGMAARGADAGQQIAGSNTESVEAKAAQSASSSNVLPGGSAGRAMDDQIQTLQRALVSRRPDIDARMLAALDTNLELVDQAVQASLAALRRDPSNQFISDRYIHALGAKVTLLRAAVMLRPATE